MWSGTAPPPGWALCDGGVYPSVSSSGSVTAPDLRGRFVLGYNPINAGAFAPEVPGRFGRNNIGMIGGTVTHTLTVDEMPSHRHQQWATDTKFVTEYAALPSGGSAYSGPPYVFDGTGFTGGGLPHNNMPPYYVLAYIIKL